MHSITTPTLFSYYANHRNRHSFPTRRSSDLRTLTRSPRAIPWENALPWVIVMISQTAVADDPRERIRSEEHTSELQSRRDLVCRLLLEKKKNDLDLFHLDPVRAVGFADGELL